MRPGSLGYAFDTWNTVRLRDHLVKVTGIQIGGEWVRQLLRAEGLSFRRPVTAVPPASHPTPTTAKPQDAARTGGRRRPK